MSKTNIIEDPEFIRSSYDHARTEMVSHIEFRRKIEGQAPFFSFAIFSWLIGNPFSLLPSPSEGIYQVLYFIPAITILYFSFRWRMIEKKIKGHIKYLQKVEALFQKSESDQNSDNVKPRIFVGIESFFSSGEMGDEVHQEAKNGRYYWGTLLLIVFLFGLVLLYHNLGKNNATKTQTEVSFTVKWGK